MFGILLYFSTYHCTNIGKMFNSVADPECFVYPGSRIRIFSIPDPNPNSFHLGFRIRIKEFNYFNPKNWFRNSRKYDLGCSSRILIFYPSRIPNPGLRRHRIPDPDPQH
jgi:hypothetical protein